MVGPPTLSPLFNVVENALPPQKATGSALPFAATDGTKITHRPGSVFDQLTRQAGADTRAPQTARAPAPTEGQALSLQGHAALFAQPLAHTREAYAPQGNPLTVPNASQDIPGSAGMRFKNLFNRSPASPAAPYGGRDVPLSLHLNNCSE